MLFTPCRRDDVSPSDNHDALSVALSYLENRLGCECPYHSRKMVHVLAVLSCCHSSVLLPYGRFPSFLVETLSRVLQYI